MEKKYPELTSANPKPEPKSYAELRAERNALSIKAGEQDRKTVESMQKTGKH